MAERDATPLWEPSADVVERSTLTRYCRWLERERGLSFGAYHDLWVWSVDDLEAFWQSIWDFFGVIASPPHDRVLGRRQMPGAEWFPGAELSYAEHVFRGKGNDTVALVHQSELRPLQETTWGELRAGTAA